MERGGPGPLFPRGAAPRSPWPTGARPLPARQRATDARLTEADWHKCATAPPTTCQPSGRTSSTPSPPADNSTRRDCRRHPALTRPPRRPVSAISTIRSAAVPALLANQQVAYIDGTQLMLIVCAVNAAMDAIMSELLLPGPAPPLPILTMQCHPVGHDVGCRRLETIPLTEFQNRTSYAGVTWPVVALWSHSDGARQRRQTETETSGGPP